MTNKTSFANNANKKRLEEAGVVRGYRCGQKPGNAYFEKQNDGSWKRINAISVAEAFAFKRWKLPAVAQKAGAVTEQPTELV